MKCCRCCRVIDGRHTSYTLHDAEGYKITMHFHRSCAIAFADVLLHDNTKRRGGLFGGEGQTRAALDRILGELVARSVKEEKG